MFLASHSLQLFVSVLGSCGGTLSAQLIAFASSASLRVYCGPAASVVEMQCSMQGSGIAILRINQDLFN